MLYDDVAERERSIHNRSRKRGRQFAWHGPSYARRRARKDARMARTHFPGRLIVKGAPGRRVERQREQAVN